MKLSPIILFVFNRPEHTARTLAALGKNEYVDESEIYIYSDGVKEGASDPAQSDIEKVRDLIKRVEFGQKVHIIERERNFGLADNIVDGVTEVINMHGRAIILEDDILTSPGFLRYMNEALERYENTEEVMHVSGYMFPVDRRLPSTFFYNTASCWGWGTWERAWKHYNSDAGYLANQIEKKKLIQQFNIEDSYPFYNHLIANAKGEMKTWAVKWYASFFLKGGLALHPYPSLVNNIGHDGLGENSNRSSKYNWNCLAKSVPVIKIQDKKENEKAKKAMVRFNTGSGIREMAFKRYIRKISLRFKIGLKSVLISNKNSDPEELELQRIKRLPRYTLGETDILGKKIAFLDGMSFNFMYREIFVGEIYKFNSYKSQPYIIDAGANIGLSVLYFKKKYPHAEIVAFEPDKAVFSVLKKNIQHFGFDDVSLLDKAVYNEDTTLTFFQEGADAGRIATVHDSKNLLVVPATSLRPFLEKKSVDFLKIDIEGAETLVLEDCADLLYNVERIFIEYHSFAKELQSLDKILKILTENSFRYYVSHIGVYSPNPFHKRNEFLGMDNQLNIYAYRN